MYKKPTSQSYFEKLLQTTNLNWKEIYILLKKASVDANAAAYLYTCKITKPLCNEVQYFVSRFFFNWDSLYARRNSHYKAWS